MSELTDSAILYDRPTRDEYYLKIAEAVSLRSTCIKRHYGAVIVNNDEIIATGYNGNVRGELNCNEIGKCLRPSMQNNDASFGYSDCRSVHAEQNALISAARKDMLGGMMYLVCIINWRTEINSKGPCPICKRMMKNAGLKCWVGWVKGDDGVVRPSVTEL